MSNLQPGSATEAVWNSACIAPGCRGRRRALQAHGQESCTRFTYRGGRPEMRAIESEPRVLAGLRRSLHWRQSGGHGDGDGNERILDVQRCAQQRRRAWRVCLQSHCDLRCLRTVTSQTPMSVAGSAAGSIDPLRRPDRRCTGAILGFHFRPFAGSLDASAAARWAFGFSHSCRGCTPSPL